jgi:DNA-binding response OmpR family regulator
LDDLDIGYVEEKKNIMKKILKVKRQKYLNNGKIAELVNIILNNFRLTKIFLELFEKYILDNESDNFRKNIHIKNFKVNLMNKKNHIEIEYNKNLDQLKELVNYFSDFADCIYKQLKKQELLNYFMEHIKIDLNKLLIIQNDKEFKINNTEKIILEKMINEPGKTFSREAIGKLIDLDKERSIDVIITRLRKKIEIDPKNPKYLQTLRGAGYVLWIE